MAKVSGEGILETLRARFEKNMHRHEGIEWKAVEKRLGADKGTLKSLAKMDETGGEPDVVGLEKATGELIFCD